MNWIYPAPVQKNASAGAGFTLTELLIAIGIMGILMSGLIAIIDPVDQMKRTRDSKVKSNISQIQTALELFRADCGRYPNSLPGASGSLTNAGCGGPQVTYLQNMPSFRSTLHYNPGSGYTLWTCLESTRTSGDGVVIRGQCNPSGKAFEVQNP